MGLLLFDTAIKWQILLCKKLHILYKLCKGDIVVGDIKLQRSPLQNSSFTITHCQNEPYWQCTDEGGIS